jgi:hypothetical protein
MFRIIIVSPAFDRRGKRKHGLFDARLQGKAAVLLCRSHQPLLDAARVLIGRGVGPGKGSASAKVTASAADRSSYGGDVPWR